MLHVVETPYSMWLIVKGELQFAANIPGVFRTSYAAIAKMQGGSLLCSREETMLFDW